MPSSCQNGPANAVVGRQAKAWRRWAAASAALLAAALLAGCGTLPAGVQRTPSTALAAADDSPLVVIARASTPSADETGVRLLPLGAFSLDARVQLAQRARRSLDVQYYVIENDPTGRLLLRELRAAAERGVRVRLLVDDLYTTHTDVLLRAFSAHPNVQVRLFNPFCCAREGGVAARFAASLFDFKRVNRRMHNKLFIADGVMAVAGGRNIADEYFLRHSEQNFVDMDAFLMGAVVPDLAAIFDRYWNSEVVYPIEAIDAGRGSADEQREAFAQLVDPRQDPKRDTVLAALPPVDVLGYGPVGEEFEQGRIGLIWGLARAFADPPEKVFERDEKEAVAKSVSYDVMMTTWQAERELVITSPYLIPGPKGVLAIHALRGRQVKVTLLTNSLAATDEPLVHTGYSRYRVEMLRSGVELYELSPTRTQRAKRLGMFGSSLGRLHAKTAVVDGKRIFIGSMNLDPRSLSSNTEIGIFIDSPALARELLRVVNISKLQSAYRLRLRGDGGIEWLAADDDKEIVLDVEPESTWLLRLHNLLFGLFVPEQLL